ncbi:hypothetical protein GPA27_25855 [Aromatoleum toluolicum]|uniref:Uncharacterized protein n=1 Tax=Aromatoleum toluolicum TaxID=90060 RepID=A0ABX1NNT6_9RHOO|nr:hypothetical protein [Aromatoleum toluolicum]NMG00811.1 hypothetical protein [Aromatoleum toluolicum]
MPLLRIPGCFRDCDVRGTQPRPHGTGKDVDCSGNKNIPARNGATANEGQGAAGEHAVLASLR